MVPKELLAFGTTVKKKESALYGETALAGLHVCQGPLLAALHLLTNYMSICLHIADVVLSFKHRFGYCSVLWQLSCPAAPNMRLWQIHRTSTLW